jgi:hypothetical protein
MLGRIVQESTYIDATVIGVHGDKELLYLETPEHEEVLRVIPCPPKYEQPCKDYRVKLELRLELSPDKRRQSWRNRGLKWTELKPYPPTTRLPGANKRHLNVSLKRSQHFPKNQLS